MLPAMQIMTRWMSSLAALAIASSACQPRDAGAAPAPAAARPPEHDEGEDRAVAVAAHKLGALAPALTVKTIDGKTIDLAKLYGDKPVYLKFWATWCIPCRDQMPGFEHIHQAFGDRMTVIAVNTGLDDDAATVRAFRDQYGLHMPIVVDDGRLAAALDLQVTPQHVLIGRDARIAYVGHQDGAKLDRAIEAALAAPGPKRSVAGEAVTVRPAFRPGELVQGLAATASDGSKVPVGKSRDGRPRGLVMFSLFCESYLKDSRPHTSRACKRVREQVDQLIAQGGIEWLGIASGLWSSIDGIPKYQTKTGTKLAVALDIDGTVFRAFGVHDMPVIALLDRDGRLVRLVGPDDQGLAEAARALTR
jgi:thiol-disulfide isomerase/thioredoxin